MTRPLLALAVAWMALTGAAPLPLAPPPPDLVPLLPWAKAPLDKPAVEVPRLALPAPPSDLPLVPVPPLEAPAEPKPTAPVPAPRTLPCVGAWLGIASESLECGRARFGRGEYEEAARALEGAVRSASDRDLLAEARYWHAEALYRLGRLETADWAFRQVAQDQGRRDFGPWALHGSGWTALRLGDFARARDAFTRLLAAPHPVPLDVWGRHGLALALYALGQYGEALKVWGELAGRRVPPALDRDILFWRGETLGRAGQAAQAADELKRFTQGGDHLLLGVGLVRQGWWSLRAGRADEAAAAFRAFLSAPSLRAPAAERDWAEAGLTLALAEAGDWTGLQAPLRALDTRRSPLALPLRLRLAAAALAAGRIPETQALVQELLAGTLAAGVRPWVLLVKGEAHRAAGERDDARTQFDLARAVDPSSDIGRYATFRLAQINVEMREFAQARQDLAPLLSSAASRELLGAALILSGEAAYQAGDYRAAEAAYQRVLAETPDHPQAPRVRLALAWTAMRQGRTEDARRQFVEFADAVPADPHAPDALVLAAELALDAGALDTARGLLDRVIAAYPTHPRSEFARLNRAVLMLREGQAPAAQGLLRDWVGRAPFPPLLGRAQTALGAALLAGGAPDEAARAFQAARREGVGALAALGLGVAALARNRADEAVRELTAARDGGTAEIAAAAEYGLAAVAFRRGATADFKKAAEALLKADPRGPLAPGLLYALAGTAAAEKDWPAALGAARRLVQDFPAHEAADDALERVGEAAAKAAAWPVAYEAYSLLRQRYPQSPFVATSGVAYGQALLETGRSAEARRALEATPSGERSAEAWIALGRAREAAGDARGALEAFARVGGEGVEWSREARLSHARVLIANRRWADARRALEPLLRSADPADVAEAAAAVGDTYRGEGAPLDAVEYYMTAAYVAPESPAGRRALVEAGRSFAALKQPDAAATVYRKLLAQSGVPADLVKAARDGLAELRR